MSCGCSCRRIVRVGDIGPRARLRAASSDYRRPSSFTAGTWFSNRKIATLLVIGHQIALHGARRDDSPQGIAIPRKVRTENYGLTDEVYVSIHELQEFGLIKIVDPMPNRRRGRFKPVSSEGESSFDPVPYRFLLELPAFDQNAFATVTSALGAAKPPRFRS